MIILPRVREGTVGRRKYRLLECHWPTTSFSLTSQGSTVLQSGGIVWADPDNHAKEFPWNWVDRSVWLGGIRSIDVTQTAWGTIACNMGFRVRVVDQSGAVMKDSSNTQDNVVGELGLQTGGGPMASLGTNTNRSPLHLAPYKDDGEGGRIPAGGNGLKLEFYWGAFTAETPVLYSTGTASVTIDSPMQMLIEEPSESASQIFWRWRTVRATKYKIVEGWYGYGYEAIVQLDADIGYSQYGVLNCGPVGGPERLLQRAGGDGEYSFYLDGNDWQPTDWVTIAGSFSWKEAV